MDEGRGMKGRKRDGGREVGVSNGSLSLFMCGDHGLWSLFVLVSAQLVLVVVLAIGGPWAVGGDGVHLSMCVDGGGGHCQSNMVMLELANTCPCWWVLM